MGQEQILHYTVLEKLGEGGMGVVYKAHDTKLDRAVALKFLPAHLSASEQDKARFIQEAKSAAALSHPNICTIYGIEENDGRLFIAMEFVDGQTLRDRRSTVSFKQAIDIGIQIADGLAAAHEKGIVHRDIKPENIMVRKDGIVQIMDFGLAKLRGVSRLTKEGSTVGTAGYMSPEQVQGQDVDHRSDVFSLGVLLYEMFTGQMPFKGVHETAVMYEIVNVDAPPMASHVPMLDASLDAIVLECLAKEKADRYQSAAEVAKELRRVKRESSRSRVSRIVQAQTPAAPTESGALPAQPQMSSGETPVPVLPARPPRKFSFWMASTATLLLGIVGLGGWFTLRPSTPAEIVWASIETGRSYRYRTDVGGHLSLSPDGLTLAFVAIDTSGQSTLYVRRLSERNAVRLAGTDDAIYPFWSPDGHFVAFFAQGKLKRVSVSGSPPISVADAAGGRGGAWREDGTILFAPGPGSGLFKVSVEGGEPVAVTKLDSAKSESSHRWPQFLPDANRFLYVVQSSGGLDPQDEVRVGSMDGTFSKLILRGTSNAVWSGSYLVYVQELSLLAHPFDPSSLEFRGEPVPLATPILYNPPRSRAGFSVAPHGSLVFHEGASADDDEMVWLNRQGVLTSVIGRVAPSYRASVSPAGDMIAYDDFDPDGRNYDIWIHDLKRNVTSRFTFDKAIEIVPVWSGDGKKVLFASNRGGRPEIFAKYANGMSTEEKVAGGKGSYYASDVSRDNRFILISEQSATNNTWDLLLVDMQGDKIPVPLVVTRFNEWNGVLSPDAQWMAYQSDESGRNEVYLQPLKGSGTKIQVSTGGGTLPLWREGGRRIYFLSRDTRLMAADVERTKDGVRVGIPVQLFELNAADNVRILDVSTDGQKILASRTRGGKSESPISLVLNWEKVAEKK